MTRTPLTTTLRQWLFWCHLVAGVAAGVVILIMCVTGVLLTYEKAITLWVDTRDLAITAPVDASTRLSIEALMARVSAAEPSLTPTTLAVRARATMPVALAAGPRMLYVDPYSGAIVGEGSTKVRAFFRSVTDWHRYLAASGESRPTGRAVTGAANLAFLFIVISGICMWWPRSWNWNQIRTVLLFNGRLRGKARDFNWHNVIGFWSAVPLFFIVLGSAVISYPWASNLIYRIAGEDPPAPARAAGTSPAAGAIVTIGLDNLWARAEAQVPDWRIISLRLATKADAPAVFTIDSGTGGQPQKRGTLTLSRADANGAKWEPFSAMTAGRRLRSWLRFVHTGEFYGLVGQTIAGLASLGGAILVFTGLSLACRRFAAWIGRRRNGRSSNGAVSSRAA